MKTSEPKPVIRVWLLFVYFKQSQHQRETDEHLNAALISHKISCLWALKLKFYTIWSSLYKFQPIKDTNEISGEHWAATITALSENPSQQQVMTLPYLTV